jgi:hypothetical protein
MAKRRGGGGGGSNMGLIITLVFFILTTVTLGVTTYMGYSEIKEHDDKRKEAEKAKTELEKEVQWYKFQTSVVREYLGHPSKDEKVGYDRVLLAKHKEEFSRTGNVAGRFPDKAPGQADFKGLVETLDKSMVDKDNKTKSWQAPADLSPPITYVTMVQAKDKAITDARNDAERALKQKEEAEAEQQRLQTKLNEADKLFKDAINTSKTDANKDRDKDRAEIRSLSTSLDKENKDKAKALADHADAEKKRADLEVKLKATEGKLAEESRGKNKAETQREELKTQLAEVSKRVRDEDKTLADKALDPEAQKELGNWHKTPAKMKWKIVRMDLKGTMPYINLGSADGLETQTTFSVHSLGRDGKLSPTPKGTVEVIQLVPNERHLARVRITSQTDAKNDPIVAGDQLFNPTWGPGQSKRVAIAGLADLGGEGTEDSADLRRLLKRQGVVVDAYVATKNAKVPELLNDKGEKGDVTSKTNYLIVADGLLDAIPNHAKKNDKEYVKAVNDLIGQMRTKATANGITVISLQRYLEMIGYKPSKVSSSRDGR